MFIKLTIKNVALIAYEEIELGKGLNIFSGETGAGKSIMVDAINFMLGAKADKSFIRYGEEQAFIEGVFDISSREDIKLVLEDFGIQSEDTLILSRMFSQSSKNEVRINGRIVTLYQLREVSQKLVDVYGQSEHFSLAKVSSHIDIVDKFGKSEIAVLKSNYDKVYLRLLENKKNIDFFGGSESERERKIDLLRYQVNEIEEAKLKANEENELKARFELFSNVEKITKKVGESLGCLDGEGAGFYLLKQASSLLFQLVNISPQFEDYAKRLKNVSVEVDDVVESLKDYLEGIEFSEKELDAIVYRLDKIKSLKKKYGNDVESVLEFLEKASAQLDMLITCEEKIGKLNSERNKILKELKEVSQALTAARKESAKRLEKAITQELSDLSMAGAKFVAEFKNGNTQTSNTQEQEENIVFGDEKYTKNGADDVEFMLSANQGEPLKPLVKVISGGEMSRFMLAVKNITSDLDNIPTVLFDEIDTGISGNVANTVGDKFISVSKNHQVIVISHLAQIAASGDYNYLISKKIVDGKTFSNIVPLDISGKTLEIARLVGGDSSEKSLNYASEMISKRKRQ